MSKTTALSPDLLAAFEREAKARRRKPDSLLREVLDDLADGPDGPDGRSSAQPQRRQANSQPGPASQRAESVTWRVEFADEAARTFRKLDKPIARRISTALGR